MSNCVDWMIRLNETKSDGTKWKSDELAKALSSISKCFIFQLEKGEGGLLHFQGALRLIKKSTKNPLLKLFEQALSCSRADAPQYCEPSTIRDKVFNYAGYCNKLQSRVSESITDKTYKSTLVKEPEYVGFQYAGLLSKLYPYQQSIYDNITPDSRTINVIVDNAGCTGKSTVAHLCRLYRDGIVVPPVNDAKELVATVCDICTAKEIRKVIQMFIDMPRAMSKDKLYGIYSAIEQIKSGHVYDMRYSYKSWDMDSPIIWLFCNQMPDRSLLSKDRWKIWTINEKKELVEYEETNDADESEPMFIEEFDDEGNLMTNLNKKHVCKIIDAKRAQKELSKLLKSKSI